MTARGVPVSTYRLQLTPDFGFGEAAEAAGYLADLGVTHAYLSPVLEAVPGSRHGYDVTDHSRIRGELGGEDGFRSLAARLRAAGLGIVLDIVPNHMAVPKRLSLNRQLWTVLRDGPEADCAHWFDVDWAAGDGRMVLPVLGGPVDSCLPDLAVDPRGGDPVDGEPVLRYFEQELPLAPGTAGLPLADLLDAQHYRLAYWRDVAELNWRRFFDVTRLIGIRVEDPGVFAATHEVILGLVADGLVDALRVDHPDGLADPRGYLRRLAAETGGSWVVAEKILAVGERLPDDWPCAGTTGYDALRLADGLFVDPDGAGGLLEQYARFAGQVLPFAEVAYAAKHEIARGALAPELARLARLLCELRPDATAEDARQVLGEVLAAFGVYRAYVAPGEPPPDASEAAVRSAVSAASGRLRQALHALAVAAGDLALGRGAAAGEPAAAEFVVRFQQTTGPVLAKGIEDTACYRWPRLISLNEVGGNPDRFGVRPDEFHAQAGRLAADWPATMTTLSTHDTKREEDVRARLAVLAEQPAAWGRQVARWHDRAARLGGPPVDPDTEYMLWQTLVGAWPIGGKRLAGYLEKAIREAKTRTSWTSPDPEYEAAVQGLAAAILADATLAESIGAFVARIGPDAMANSLGTKLVQLTMPGTADVYNGCELGGFYLVDPDNRRPVDFARGRSLLAVLDAAAQDAASPDAGGLDAGGRDAGGWPDAGAGLDAAKLLVTSRALRLRRDHPGWFAGSYLPLTAAGAAAGHAVAFARGGRAVTVATRLPAGLRNRGGWAGTVLTLPTPAAAWVDVLTGSTYHTATVPLAALTRRLPVALLVPEAR
ncbi:malto-oligosyltrehalose synthase [Trebonia sp.]|uniref:malto-oligosyltrehalose synthase n=1 Tax=Trebonia sp. TaxID=2767075 RepID=UPI002638AF54|nr:malto-oligosyltrehalose synthase [Trebonia sp.]